MIALRAARSAEHSGRRHRDDRDPHPSIT